MRRLRPAVERQVTQMKQAINRTFLFGEPRPLTADERRQLREHQRDEMKAAMYGTLLFGERYAQFAREKRQARREKLARVWKW